MESKTSFFLCSAQYAKWQGQCNSCKEWNTIAEEIIKKRKKWPGKNRLRASPKAFKINEIDSTQESEWTPLTLN
jgi:DNA repair protein RadA/Sms